MEEKNATGTQTMTAEERKALTLRLREKKIVWAADVVNNEHMCKKSSKSDTTLLWSYYINVLNQDVVYFISRRSLERVIPMKPIQTTKAAVPSQRILCSHTCDSMHSMIRFC